MPHAPEDKKRAITRLRRIRGQAEALENTIAVGATCGDVLQQLAAMRGAINGLMADVLEGHLRESLGVADRAPGAAQPEEQMIEEISALVRRYLK